MCVYFRKLLGFHPTQRAPSFSCLFYFPFLGRVTSSLNIFLSVVIILILDCLPMTDNHPHMSGYTAYFYSSLGGLFFLGISIYLLILFFFSPSNFSLCKCAVISLSIHLWTNI